MKKIFVLMFGVFAAAQVFAQTTVCANGTPTDYVSTNTATNPAFVVRGFPVRCSANVQAVARENAIAFAVGSVSLKGKSRFQGNTGGGAISAAACANPKVCDTSDPDVGLSAILNAAT